MNGGRGDRGASEFLLTSQSDDLIQIEIIGSYDSWQDNFGRLHDRSKEISKVIKQLGHLFPNRMTIQLPQILWLTKQSAFDDIGALENVKDTLKELVMLPLQRPKLFCKGQLTKPCKGILLFGSPGTGKFMLAKIVSIEARANFINISISGITSKWFGEGEKYVKLVFSLASKIAPSVISVH
ncbi:Fidgetin-like protein [Arachis hypogaea]|nr:Fidgetin-like protein [Arachis hypogaea]